MTITRKFAVLVLTVVAGFVAFGAITYCTLNKVKVTGPLYTNIILGKDVVADILPPPEYIIESYLTTMQLVATPDPVEQGTLKKKLAQLRKDYEDRQTYWNETLAAGEMRELMLVKSSDPARRFYTLADERLFPLLLDGKQEEAAVLMSGDMRAAYDQHRSAIDELVTLSLSFTQEAETTAKSELAQGWTILRTVGAGSLFALVLLSVLTARSVTRPLARMIAGITEIRESNDMTKRLEVASRDEIGGLGTAFNGMIQTLHDIIAEVRAGSSQLDAGGTQITSASQSLAQGVSKQASSLQQISASLEEISAQTQQSSENARQANTLSQDSKKAADRGQVEMAQMSKAVNEIKQSGNEISKIIKVIDEIAFQTNLLALNAAVEAARAGEAGKGFAVVAEEVRHLARRSAEAAKSTSAMIEDSVRRSDNGVQIAQRVGQALDEIVTGTHKVNTLLSEIASASSEQATGIGQITQGMSQLDQVTQQNAGNSEELASSSEELASQVASLDELVAQFKVSSSGHEAVRRPSHFVAQRNPPAPALPARSPSKQGRKSPLARAATERQTRASSAELAIPMGDDDVLGSF